MPSVEENNLLEQHAKFEAVQELLVMDINSTDPSNAKLKGVQMNHGEYRQLYLALMVAFKKYKMKYVPKSITEADFNAEDSGYYNDSWLGDIKKEFRTINEKVLEFLENSDCDKTDA